MHMVRDDNELESHRPLTPSLLGMLFFALQRAQVTHQKDLAGKRTVEQITMENPCVVPIKMVDFPWRHVSLQSVILEFSWGGGKRERVVGSLYLRSSPIFFHGNFVILTLRLRHVLAVCQYVSQHTRLNF